MDRVPIEALIVVGMVLAVVLVLASSMTLGRKVADLEYQIAAGLNGVRRIQSWINIRTHSNRIVLGLAFLVMTMMRFADVAPEWRAWIAYGLFTLVLGAYAVSSVKDWLDERRQVRLLLLESGGLHATAEGRDSAYGGPHV